MEQADNHQGNSRRRGQSRRKPGQVAPDRLPGPWPSETTMNLPEHRGRDVGRRRPREIRHKVADDREFSKSGDDPGIRRQRGFDRALLEWIELAVDVRAENRIVFRTDHDSAVR